MFRHIFVILLVATAVAQSPANEPSPWALLVDPACPVAPMLGVDVPNASKQIRIMYFPGVPAAKLKKPETLSLYIVFNGPNYIENRAVIPFTRNGDRWEADIGLEKAHPMYAIFYVKDEKSGAIDDNRGEYWETIFCEPTGEKSPHAFEKQAATYSGAVWPFAIHRKKDLDKAISILEPLVLYGERSQHLVAPLWKYKAERLGGDTTAYAKLVPEIDLKSKTRAQPSISSS